MPRAKELTIRVDDRPGVLGEIASALGEQKVNIRAIHGWSEGTQAVLRLVAEPHAAAKRLLAKRGWTPEEAEVVEVELADKPGALGAAGTALGAAGVNVLRVYVGTAGGRKASVFMAVSDAKAAMKALR